MDRLLHTLGDVEADFRPILKGNSRIHAGFRFDEAIPWLERAIAAKRYDPRHFPYFNLGRAYLAKGLINRARQQFQQALEIEPRYTLARRALENLRRMVN